jgi:hypothetical protein
MNIEVIRFIGSIAALITATGVILLAVKRVYVFARRIENALGSDKNGKTISDRLGRVEHQVFPNGGGSLSDQITEVNKTINTLLGKVDTIETLVLTQNSNGVTNNNKRTSRSPSEVVKSSTVKKSTTNK